MLAVMRFEVPADAADAFGAGARAALAALGERPGFRVGRLGRSVDDPSAWVLTSEWDGAGSYRRALSAYDVKMATGPIMVWARNEPSAYAVVEASPASTPESVSAS